MQFKLTAMLLLIALAGCSNKHNGPVGAVESKIIEDAKPPSSRFLAYSHAMHIDAAEDKIVTVFDAGRAACAAAAIDLCAILESEISKGKEPSATLKFRAKPSGIAKLRKALSAQGEVTQQSTMAEDLEGPISDGEQKLAMLKQYRAKLEALRERASSDIDALIKVTHELAEVQGQLEELTGKQAHLTQRVETEILTVTIGAANSQSFSKPIAGAMSEFGEHLSRGIAAAITAVASVAPFAVILALVAWIVRVVRRRRKPRPVAV